MRISDLSSDVCSSDLPGVDDAADRGEEGARRHDHLVARIAAVDSADPESVKREVECYRPVGKSDGMAALAPIREFAFERAAFVARPVIDAVRPQYRRDRLRLLLGEVRPRCEGCAPHIISFP